MNQEEQFKSIIFLYAERIKGSKLTIAEKNKIIEGFNESNKTKSIDRVNDAIQGILNENTYYKLIENTASSLDNIDDLLSQLKTEADKWDNK